MSAYALDMAKPAWRLDAAIQVTASTASRAAPSLSDTELLRAARRDHEAYRLFYRRHAEGMQAFLRRRLGSDELAVEFTAETFAQAWFSIKRFKGSDPDDGARWIYGIAGNLLRQYYRRAAVGENARKKLRILEDTRFRPRMATEVQNRSDLERALATLSEDDREVIRLRYERDLSFAEIADLVGLSEGALRVRVSRALKALRVHLPEYAADDGVSGGGSDE